MITSIKKRDGRVVPFDLDKIQHAVTKAFEGSGSAKGDETARMISEQVEKELENNENIGSIPTVEEVQDRDLHSIARYAFSPDELKQFEESTNKAETFFRTWVSKEAFVKWTGEGITSDLKKLPMNGWHQFIDLGEGYCCAVQAEKSMAVKVEEVRNL